MQSFKMQNVKKRWKTSCFDVSCTNLQPKASLFRAQHHASSLFRNTYHASKAHGRITFMQGLTIYLRLTVGRMGKGVGRTEIGGWAITGSTSVLGLFPQGFIGSFFSLPVACFFFPLNSRKKVLFLLPSVPFCHEVFLPFLS